MLHKGALPTKGGDSRAPEESLQQRATVEAKAETEVERDMGGSANAEICKLLSGLPGLTEPTPTLAEAAPGAARTCPRAGKAGTPKTRLGTTDTAVAWANLGRPGVALCKGAL